MKFLLKNVWIVLLAAFCLGLANPRFAAPILDNAKHILVLILFFVLLKVDVKQLITQLSRWPTIAGGLLFSMIIFPALVFVVASQVSNQAAIALFLLMAVPSATSSGALTDTFKGNVPLAIAMSVISNLIAPLTLPLLTVLVVGESIELNAQELFKTLTYIVFTPVIASTIIRKLAKKHVKKLDTTLSSFSIFALAVLIYGAVGEQKGILTNTENLPYLGFVTAVILALMIFEYWLEIKLNRKKPKEDALALATASAFMNITMAIVIAKEFFGPEVLTLVVLAELPWSVMPFFATRIKP